PTVGYLWPSCSSTNINVLHAYRKCSLRFSSSLGDASTRTSFTRPKCCRDHESNQNHTRGQGQLSRQRNEQHIFLFNRWCQLFHWSRYWRVFGINQLEILLRDIYSDCVCCAFCHLLFPPQRACTWDIPL